ncbi:MAG: glycosyltransferase family 1 protein [Prevotellaceae bacterium]|nr:glycosyltransferase family 1 protein [Prevotellaceae bacterium]
MKILYDSQGFDMQRHGGVSRCFVELSKHLPSGINAVFSVVETNNVYLNNIGIPISGTLYNRFPLGKDNKVKNVLYKLYYNTVYWNIKNWDSNPQLNVLESIKQIKKGDYDIFHPTFFSPYFLPYLRKDKPLVLTVHDMIVELFPNYYPPTDSQLIWKKILIPKADHIITVSERTKCDLQKLFNVPENKISVIYHGSDQTKYIPSDKGIIDGEYLLYVGDRWLYKNFGRFVKAVAPILNKHKELSVVCTGSPFNYDEIQLLKEQGVYERFIQMFIKSDQEFLDLYHYAVTFVYPSEYEGFGIPILEAYKADCPVMLNNASCFPEIAGDAAIYFNMNDEESDFEDKFETLYHLNSNERENLLRKQRQRLSLYTWEKSAQQLADVYKKLC